jgi:hypothetical protein
MEQPSQKPEESIEINEEAYKDPLVIEAREKINLLIPEKKELEQAEVDRIKEIYLRIFEFSKYLEGKYPECKKYRLFHVLIGSSIPKECDKSDFEGNDSILSFLDSLIEEYLKPSSK